MGEVTGVVGNVHDRLDVVLDDDDANSRKGDVTGTLAPATPLTAADRCDRCSAQAYVRVVLAGGELLFCAHHSREYSDSLQKVAVEIHDETDRLHETSTNSSDEEC